MQAAPCLARSPGATVEHRESTACLRAQPQSSQLSSSCGEQHAWVCITSQGSWSTALLVAFLHVTIWHPLPAGLLPGCSQVQQLRPAS